MPYGLRVPQGGGFWEKGQIAQEKAIGAYSSMQPGRRTETTAPGLTMGGAISAGAGMGMAGYMMAGAKAGGLTGPQGAAIGAGVGIISYLLS